MENSQLMGVRMVLNILALSYMTVLGGCGTEQHPKEPMSTEVRSDILTGDRISVPESKEILARELQRVTNHDGISQREAIIIAKAFLRWHISPEGELRFLGLNGDCWEFNLYSGLFPMVRGDKMKIDRWSGAITWRWNERKYVNWDYHLIPQESRNQQ